MINHLQNSHSQMSVSSENNNFARQLHENEVMRRNPLTNYESQNPALQPHTLMDTSNPNIQPSINNQFQNLPLQPLASNTNTQPSINYETEYRQPLMDISNPNRQQIDYESQNLPLQPLTHPSITLETQNLSLPYRQPHALMNRSNINNDTQNLPLQFRQPPALINNYESEISSLPYTEPRALTYKPDLIECTYCNTPTKYTSLGRLERHIKRFHPDWNTRNDKRKLKDEDEVFPKKGKWNWE